MGYAEYLASPQWKARRDAAMERAGHRRQVCGYDGWNLNVHHNSYDRIGCERPEDLVVLCRLCHNRHHDTMPAPPKRASVTHVLPALKRAAQAMRARGEA